MKNKKIGRPYGLKTQIKGFAVFASVALVLIFAMSLSQQDDIEKVHAETVEVEQGEEIEIAEVGKMIEWSDIKIKYYGNKYPDSREDRRDYIIEYLAWNYPDLSGEEINNLVDIAAIESKEHDPNVRPIVEVKICKKDGRFKNRVVELTKRDGLNVQDYCENYGETEIASTYSLGIFQILIGNFKNYGCGEDVKNPDIQIDCAVKIYKRSGYNAWPHTAKLLGLI